MEEREGSAEDELSRFECDVKSSTHLLAGRANKLVPFGSSLFPPVRSRKRHCPTSRWSLDLSTAQREHIPSFAPRFIYFLSCDFADYPAKKSPYFRPVVYCCHYPLVFGQLPFISSVPYPSTSLPPSPPPAPPFSPRCSVCCGSHYFSVLHFRPLTKSLGLENTVDFLGSL